MKGSLKIKFDLGWVFSLALVTTAAIFGVARVSVAMDIQNSLESVCYNNAVTTHNFLAENNMKNAPVATLQEQCITEYKKPLVALAINTNLWDFKSSYPKVVKDLKL